jgi:proteasome accessory factor C
VLGLDVLELAAEVPADAEPKDVDQGLFRPSAADLNVVIELAPLGRWVAEYYPCETIEELGDGRLRVALRTPDPGWVRRLALRLGEHGRIVAPASLAAQVREDASAALGQYA